MTDVFLANINNYLSIYCIPLDRKHEKLHIKFLRFIEDSILKFYFIERKES